jgi:8-oxo-dGTP pyrophosphatase MutT (NUDIX family)
MTSTLWLAQWNEKWKSFNFIGGHKEESESFRECIVREIEEELHIVPGRDFSIDNEPLSHLEYGAWSESAGAETQYCMELFDITLHCDIPTFPMNETSPNRWLSEQEIRENRCSDGKVVSKTMSLLLSKASLWSN